MHNIISNEKLIVGIDYGAKLAGTTVICYAEPQGKIIFLASEKRKNADLFIGDFVDEYEKNLNTIFLDAPLSLPLVYSGKLPRDENSDFFYRSADKELSAMSPMFLGGLTARAMKLAHMVNHKVSFIETYPKALYKFLLSTYQISDHLYKKKGTALKELTFELSELKLLLEYKLDISEVVSWHHFDALLAFLSAHRHRHKRSICIGDKSEGCIYY